MCSEKLQRPLERRSLELVLKFARRDRLQNLASKQYGISNTQMTIRYIPTHTQRDGVADVALDPILIRFDAPVDNGDGRARLGCQGSCRFLSSRLSVRDSENWHRFEAPLAG